MSESRLDIPRPRIVSLASYIPSARVDNNSRLVELDTTTQFLDSKVGTRTVSRRAITEETSDLCTKAAERLAGWTEVRDSVDCLIVCTQNGDGERIPQTSAIVHNKLRLRTECAAFDLGMGCSGYVYGLSCLESFMFSNGLRCGLLLTGDPYSKIVDPTDRNTTLLFGDAATATLAVNSRSHGAWAVRGVKFATDGSSSSAIHVQRGRLQMDGRAVFNFCLRAVPQQINVLLATSNLTLEDIDKVVLHQGSRFIVENLAKALGCSQEKVPFDVGDYGNCVSSSIPLVLQRELHNTANRRILISGFGVGLSWASMILERDD